MSLPPSASKSIYAEKSCITNKRSRFYSKPSLLILTQIEWPRPLCIVLLILPAPNTTQGSHATVHARVIDVRDSRSLLLAVAPSLPAAIPRARHSLLPSPRTRDQDGHRAGAPLPDARRRSLLPSPCTGDQDIRRAAAPLPVARRPSLPRSTRPVAAGQGEAATEVSQGGDAERPVRRATTR